MLRPDQRGLPDQLTNMSMPSPNPSGPRMSRGIKLVLMGVAGAALLYSCAPGIGGGLGALPYLWFFSNPFFRGSAPTATTTPGTTTTSPGTATPDASKATPSQSQRGGFGSTGSSGSSSGAS
jgi:hypothetical protein